MRGALACGCRLVALGCSFRLRPLRASQVMCSALEYRSPTATLFAGMPSKLKELATACPTGHFGMPTPAQSRRRRPRATTKKQLHAQAANMKPVARALLALEDLYLHRKFGVGHGAMTAAAAHYGLALSNITYHLKTKPAWQVMIEQWKATAAAAAAAAAARTGKPPQSPQYTTAAAAAAAAKAASKMATAAMAKGLGCRQASKLAKEKYGSVAPGKSFVAREVREGRAGQSPLTDRRGKTMIPKASVCVLAHARPPCPGPAPAPLPFPFAVGREARATSGSLRPPNGRPNGADRVLNLGHRWAMADQDTTPGGWDRPRGMRARAGALRAPAPYALWVICPLFSVSVRN